MPKRNAEQKAAWALKETEGLDYQEALRRVRAEAAAESATTDAPASAPAAVVYVLQPTAAETELGIRAEELGIRALPETATPAQRAHAEAVWRPNEDPAAPCRCSGIRCHHGERCEVEFSDGQCDGRLIHVDRHPGSMFELTAWYDTYGCEGCRETFETTVTLTEIPWGEVRTRAQLDGTERTLSTGTDDRVIVLFDGIRHPNFPDSTPEEDDGDELDPDPDTHPTPEEEWNAAVDQADEEPLAEEHQEDGLDDEPRDDVDPIEPPEDYDDGPDENELGPPSRVPAVDLDPQSTADDWSLMEPRSW
ncbi:hypothetical protein QQY66_49230 [Streptomyces sp. DG2A-72]|uniref:hypothetical protein n=1 Tax=Streptomyces sp. DG2A-72 TaxID=3051386 RepID=UPI00265B8329|nr:hypothetical protein [Streptomyces sp. DG2A-72]MDO0939298.1 hypothetical protein [Streptomyces sp. DG2A-72]